MKRALALVAIVAALTVAGLAAFTSPANAYVSGEDGSVGYCWAYESGLILWNGYAYFQCQYVGSASFTGYLWMPI